MDTLLAIERGFYAPFLICPKKLLLRYSKVRNWLTYWFTVNKLIPLIIEVNVSESSE